MFRRTPIVSFALASAVCASLVASAVSSQRAADDGLVVEGLRGQIPREAVSRVVTTRMNDLIACLTSRRGDNEMLAGSVTVAFVIGANGATRSARIANSTVGDRSAERCMTTIGASLRFPAPTGGDADASETLQFPIDPEVRAPLSWTDAQLEPTRAALGRLAGRCRVANGSVRVTAYVGRGGHVMNVGAFASTPALDSTLDCIASAVAAIEFADPGSYPAKVAFDVAPAPR